MHVDVVIVGGGLAGLSCGLALQARGVPFVLLESSERVGGRVASDSHEGFVLDRGFQVLLTAYPEARTVLDYKALDLRPFYPGSLVRSHGSFHRLADPWRRPLEGLCGLFNPVGSVADKLRVASLRTQVTAGTLDQWMLRPETSTIEALRRHGFSESMVEGFFRPFLSGIFLDRELATSSRMFHFVFRMFALGETAVPARGMGEIPKQMAARLPAGSIRTGCRVTGIQPGRVTLESGEQILAEQIVLATDVSSAADLRPEVTPRPWQAVQCLYYAAPEPPPCGRALVLNGEGRGPVNNLAVMSAVSPGYAPPGQALVSVSVLGNLTTAPSQLDSQVREQLSAWYGSRVRGWRLLRHYPIPWALPRQFPPALQPPQRPARLAPWLVACGDWLDTASIQGAMASGRRAAEALLSEHH